MRIDSFSLPFSAEAVADLRGRLAQTRWPDEILDSGWDYGCEQRFLRDLCSYWKDEFDWKRQLELMAKFHHFRYDPDDLRIHFIHERGQGPDPIPLILTHGWPGSFLEMFSILPLLTDPAAHGGDASDSFDVVVPSLPGYGFSDRPAAPGMNPFRTAKLWAQLMVELGYRRFAAQGGDIGASVTTILGLRHADRILGIHLNYIPGSFRPCLPVDAKLSSSEREFLHRVSRWREECGAYSHMQSTRPQTAACALNDSPAGLAAWIAEKFREWSDCDGDVYKRFSKDELLSNVTLYWMTQTIHSSFRMYFEGRKAPLQFGPDDFVAVPCAVAHFPKELPFPPREWVQRGFNVCQWTEMPRGGHFAAAEEPELLATDLRTFFRRFRKDGRAADLSSMPVGDTRPGKEKL